MAIAKDIQTKFGKAIVESDETANQPALAVCNADGSAVGAVVFTASNNITYSQYASAAAEASKIIKASAGKLISIFFSNGTASPVYLQLANSTTLPADATVPVYTVRCEANSTISIDFSDIGGDYFSTGIVACGSTTQNTKTIGGASFLFRAIYI
jgi:hypothetical protein